MGLVASRRKITSSALRPASREKCPKAEPRATIAIRAGLLFNSMWASSVVGLLGDVRLEETQSVGGVCDASVKQLSGYVHIDKPDKTNQHYFYWQAASLESVTRGHAVRSHFVLALQCESSSQWEMESVCPSAGV